MIILIIILVATINPRIYRQMDNNESVRWMQLSSRWVKAILSVPGIPRQIRCENRHRPQWKPLTLLFSCSQTINTFTPKSAIMSDHEESDDNSSDSSYSKVDFYEGEYIYVIGPYAAETRFYSFYYRYILLIPRYLAVAAVGTFPIGYQ